MIQNKVFITQENTKHDYSMANEFGDIRFLFTEYFNFARAENSLTQKEQIEKAYDMLEDFDPRTDYILLAGCPVVIAVVSNICFKKAKGDTVRFLKFSSHKKKYEVVNIRV